jgi:hypothetical protein
MNQDGGILGLVKGGAFRWALEGITGGIGIAIAYKAIETVQARPEFLPQLLSNGVLPFSALFLAMVLFRKQSEQFIAAHVRSVVAQEQLAANVGALVAKDDQRAREQDILLDHLTRNSEDTLREIREIKAAVKP